MLKTNKCSVNIELSRDHLFTDFADVKSLAHLIFILALLFKNAGSLYEGMEL